MSDPSAARAESPSPPVRSLELLAPAGDMAALEAALESGAGAVYFGLTSLNARRGARNFRPDELPCAVEAAHARGARAYLALNIDVSQRELGQAARILELARRCGVDAVLVRDPALLALHRAYPDLELHLSTQTCMANSADAAAAARLGAARVVLARELTLDEIAAASAVPGVQTEVFVQGAMCFSVSGRCLLSSWVGGRSGNRGTCTSPCRVPWTADGAPAGTPFSMHDLAAITRLEDLCKAGVTALKIEGRLKTAAWVGQAVGLYRKALDGADPGALAEEVAALGAYTGRNMTCAYLDGKRDELTGVSGREPAPAEPAERQADAPESAPSGQESAAESPPGDEAAEAAYQFEMAVGPRAVACNLTCAGRTAQWTIPKSAVRRVHKAVTIGQFLGWLETQTIRGHRLARSATDDPEFLLVPRAVNALVERISAEIRLACKAPDQHVRIALPDEVSEVLRTRSPSSSNRLSLGDAPDRARLEAGQAAAFIKQARPSGVVVEGLTPRGLDPLLAAARRTQVVVALPQVFFESDLPAMRNLLRLCARADVSVEVNSWGGWWLARRARVRIEGGPGLPVLNALAARRLRELGIECVTLSIEADRRQLEEVCECCPVPCSLVVFGRPPLWTTRVELSEKRLRGRVLEDRRGVQLKARVGGGLWVMRPLEPFDLRASANERIRASHLVVDLVGSEDPVGDWFAAPLDNKRTFRFNYDRSLA